MEIPIIIFIASTLFLIGLVICLETVGFGRASIVSAAVAFAFGAASLICLQLIPPIWDTPTNTLAEVDRTFAQTNRLLFFFWFTFAITLIATAAFCVAGSLRVWHHRSVLVSRCNSQHSDTTPPKNASTRERMLTVVAIFLLIAMTCWEAYDFAVTNRGIQYYQGHLHMLLYPIGAAALVGASLVLFSRLARKHGRPGNYQRSSQKAT